MLNPPNRDGAEAVAGAANPPKPPKLLPPMVLVGAVAPKPNAEVEVVGCAPNPAPAPKPKLEPGVLKVLVVLVAGVLPKPDAGAGVPKAAPAPNPVGWAAGVPKRDWVEVAGVLKPKVPGVPNPAEEFLFEIIT